MAYMTYKHYILANHLPDSPESYRSYNAAHNIFWAHMVPGVREQYLKATYLYRFIQHMD